jgi:hypothetical protein
MSWTLLESICVLDNSELLKNVNANLERGLPLCKPLPERKTKLAIVGSGPSVRDYLEELRHFDGDVWAINGAYDCLQDHGIIADGFVACDPVPELIDYLKHPSHKTTFYIAGSVDPPVIDALKGYDVRLWFLEHEIDYPKGYGIYKVKGGTTMLLRAPLLAHMLGYRDLTIYGADSSFDADDRYFYKHGRFAADSGAPINTIYTTDGQGPFYTEICLIKQVAQMHAIVQLWRDKPITFRCGGLMAAFMNAPMCDDSHLREAFDLDAA